MGVIDIQRNHMTVFNIRFGEKKKTASGKEAPAMLTDAIRITSPNRQVVDAFVAVYGGKTKSWNSTEFEAYLPTTELPIMVLPGQSITQWWELYKGGVCDRRCEGTGGTEQISQKPCMCNPNVDQRQNDRQQCSLMTRLNFLCPEVEVIGAGSLVTHGKIAAETLPQAVAVAEVALKAGKMVPAILRSVTRVGKARQYVVPQIEIVGFSLQQLNAGNYEIAAPQLSGEGVGAKALNPPTEIRERSTTVASPPTPVAAIATSSDSPPASDAMRKSVMKQGEIKGLSDDELADLSLATTSKYIEEAGFTVDDANAVLDAIRNTP